MNMELCGKPSTLLSFTTFKKASNNNACGRITISLAEKPFAPFVVWAIFLYIAIIDHAICGFNKIKRPPVTTFFGLSTVA